MCYCKLVLTISFLYVEQYKEHNGADVLFMLIYFITYLKQTKKYI